MAEYMNEENRNKTKAGLRLNKSLQTKCANLQVGSVSRRPRVWLRSVMSAGVTRSRDDAAQRAAVAPAGRHQRHLCFVEKHHFVFVWQHGPPSDTPTDGAAHPAGGLQVGRFILDLTDSSRAGTSAKFIVCLLVLLQQGALLRQNSLAKQKKKKKKNNLL